MSEITRREALGRLATAFTAAATIDYALAQDVHAFLQSSRTIGPYTPKALSPSQFDTLEQLTDLIIPVDNGKPGALVAGVPAWIDQLLDVNTELRTKYTTGLSWLDSTMATRGATDFATATPDRQKELLDLIAFKKNASPELNPGIEFFTLARRMTADGFYTSDVGIRDINPGGRPPIGQFTVPQESVDFVISRSPFK